VERPIRAIRRDCLNHVIVLNERHIERKRLADAPARRSGVLQPQ
jgi:hypothetical protein